LQDFYQGVFGWQIMPKGPGYALAKTYSIFNLAVSQQNLHRAQVASRSVDHGGLCPPHRVRAIILAA
jgi:hypothetical protein